MESNQRLSEPVARPDRGFVIWFTGLPASGKTTLARGLISRLADRDYSTVLLDSDDLRPVLTPRPTYSEQERSWFYGVLAHLAVWLACSRVNVVVAATANRRSYRDRVRGEVERFVEVYVRCPIELCRERDPKGIYARADAGNAPHVPGSGVEYEPPRQAEVTVDTGLMDQVEALDIVQMALERLLFSPGSQAGAI